MEKYTCLQCSFTSKDKRHFKNHLYKVYHIDKRSASYASTRTFTIQRKFKKNSRSVHKGVNAFLLPKIKDILRSNSIRSKIDKGSASYASTRTFTIQRKFKKTQDQFTKE